MPTPDTLNRIRAADPARELPEETEAERRQAEALLERLVAEPVEPPKRRLSRRRVLVLAGAGVVAVVAAVALIVPDSERVPSGLATRAYAKTNPADGVIHEVAEFDGYSRGPSAAPVRGLPWRFEQWLRPSTGEFRYVNLDKAGKVTGEIAVDAHRTERGWSPGSKVRVGRAPSEEHYADLPLTTPLPGRSAVQQFRRAYEAGQLRDAGPSEFEGRPTRRYVVERSRSHPDGLSEHEVETWEIDAKTALPLTMTIKRTITTAGRVTGRQRLDQRIFSYEKLDPTPENLRKLRFVGPPPRG